MIRPNQTVLFQGDSITDAGRGREILLPNDRSALSLGYVGLIASEVLSRRPLDGLQFYNRGISGNRITDLLARWPKEAIPLRPHWISILIGINDCWHLFRSKTGTDLLRFEQIYRILLELTRETLPETGLILGEPFALACGGFHEEWLIDLAKRREIVRKHAADFGAILVPFQGLFDELAEEAPAEFWLPDGVHPSIAASARMARFWLERVPCLPPGTAGV